MLLSSTIDTATTSTLIFTTKPNVHGLILFPKPKAADNNSTVRRHNV